MWGRAGGKNRPVRPAVGRQPPARQTTPNPPNHLGVVVDDDGLLEDVLGDEALVLGVQVDAPLDLRFVGVWVGRLVGRVLEAVVGAVT